MSATQAHPVPIHSGLRRYAVLAALVLAIIVGTFAAYSLTRADTATGDISTVSVEDNHRGGDSCASRFVAAGGVLEGTDRSNACGAPAGRTVRGGVQP